MHDQALFGEFVNRSGLNNYRQPGFAALAFSITTCLWVAGGHCSARGTTVINCYTVMLYGVEDCKTSHRIDLCDESIRFDWET